MSRQLWIIVAPTLVRMRSALSHQSESLLESRSVNAACWSLIQSCRLELFITYDAVMNRIELELIDINVGSLNEYGSVSADCVIESKLSMSHDHSVPSERAFISPRVTNCFASCFPILCHSLQKNDSPAFFIPNLRLSSFRC